MAIDYSELLADIRQERSLLDRRKKHEPRTLRKGGRAWRRRQKAIKESVDKEVEKKYKRARVQANYYQKHKERLDKERLVREREPKNRYKKARGRALERGQRWEFKNFGEWYEMWEEAPRVYHEEKGYYVEAWAKRGGRYWLDTQMCRKDTEGPWSVENCFIGIGGKPIQERKTSDLPDRSFSEER